MVLIMYNYMKSSFNNYITMHQLISSLTSASTVDVLTGYPPPPYMYNGTPVISFHNLPKVFHNYYLTGGKLRMAPSATTIVIYSLGE